VEHAAAGANLHDDPQALMLTFCGESYVDAASKSMNTFVGSIHKFGSEPSALYLSP